MTISIWRYSHLALALVTAIFILLASVTGLILAFEPISEQLKPFKTDAFHSVSVAETVDAFKKKYPEIMEISVDANEFVLASVITDQGESLHGYFNPKTAEYLGPKIVSSKFFQFNTTLHRSLFLKGTGRFLMGLCSFLLFLIAISGTVLIVKRQGSFKKILHKVVYENFSQYWHVVLGRISLIPIVIITLTGLFLSLEQFNVLPKQKHSHQIVEKNLSAEPRTSPEYFSIFKNTPLTEVKKIEFPFSADIEDYYTLTLTDKELLIHQFTGTALSEIKNPLLAHFSNISLILHTGKGNILWAIILAIACVNILFFMYSGFAMTIKRRASQIKNTYKAKDCKYIILVGSENGSTFRYAHLLHNELIAAGETSYLTELNKYQAFKKVEQLIIMTSTYGEGEAPSNAHKFLKLLENNPQDQAFNYSIVGFGSTAYPDFCRFAFDIEHALEETKHRELIPLFTINNKSVSSFEQWVRQWIKATALKISPNFETLELAPKITQSFQVLDKTDAAEQPDQIFSLTLKPKNSYKFTSGDLLAIYPENDYKERLYSIAKINNSIQLSIKHFQNGFGSNYLHHLPLQSTLKAQIIKNASFHFPKKASRIILVANGTGVAPFLGMLAQNKKRQETHLYLGLRNTKSFELFEQDIHKNLKEKKLQQFHLALSQENEQNYVQDVLFKDAEFILQTLKNKGFIMICGSLKMHEGVIKTLGEICMSENENLEDFRHLIKSDCY